MVTGKEMNQHIRQVGFVVLMVAALCLMVYELKYFISAGLGAFTLYLLLRGFHKKLIARGWRKIFATLLLVFATVVVIFGVGGGLVSLVISKMADFHPHIIIDKVNGIHDFVLHKLGYDIFSKDVVDNAIRSATNWLPGVFAATGSMLVNGFMMLVLLTFMLQGREHIEKVTEWLPLKKQDIGMLRTEVNQMVVSNAVGIPLIVIGQAVISGLGYWMLGAGDPVIWGLLTGFAGLIPVVGSAMIWILLAVNLMFSGAIWQGVVLILYGALITANVDNVIRMVLLKKYADVHPVVTLFGIILGMNLFGFWGVIFGPLMISGFILMLKIYRNEFLGGHEQ